MKIDFQSKIPFRHQNICRLFQMFECLRENLNLISFFFPFHFGFVGSLVLLKYFVSTFQNTTNSGIFPLYICSDIYLTFLFSFRFSSHYLWPCLRLRSPSLYLFLSLSFLLPIFCNRFIALLIFRNEIPNYIRKTEYFLTLDSTL